MHSTFTSSHGCTQQIAAIEASSPNAIGQSLQLDLMIFS